MTSVREASFDLLRTRGMTTIFGNPGSTELPFLGDFPEDFTYVLGLHETVAVGMADGFAQASGDVGHVNLHTAPGVGNGMGAIFNAQANKAPLLITAGQQSRSLMTLQANLTNRDAARMPHPLVKWSYEPPRAQDAPPALARGIGLADPARAGVRLDPHGRLGGRGRSGRRGPSDRADGRGTVQPEPAAIAGLALRLEAAERPALVVGPDVDASGGWDAAVALAEVQNLPVWASPAPGGGRIGFPEDHPAFQGVLPPAVGPVGETLAAYDLVLVFGSSVFPYYPNIPGALLAEGTELVAVTSDPDEAARAPMGDALVADVGLTLEALVEEIGETSRAAPAPRPDPEPVGDERPLSPSAVHAALADVFGEDGIVVLESPSSTLALRNRLRISQPGSYFFGAGGGLGFGLAASIGVQLAQPDRRVVCVLGEGSAQYAIQGLWTAVAYRVPVTFLVLRNEEYAILKWFGQLESVTGAPGLDLPGLDTAALAAAYGMRTHRVDGTEELREALRTALASEGPELIEVAVAPGMALA